MQPVKQNSLTYITLSTVKLLLKCNEISLFNILIK
jgi:hypothetical protein